MLLNFIPLSNTTWENATETSLKFLIVWAALGFVTHNIAVWKRMHSSIIYEATFDNCYFIVMNSITQQLKQMMSHDNRSRTRISKSSRRHWLWILTQFLFIFGFFIVPGEGFMVMDQQLALVSLQLKWNEIVISSVSWHKWYWNLHWIRRSKRFFKILKYYTIYGPLWCQIAV